MRAAAIVLLAILAGCAAPPDPAAPTAAAPAPFTTTFTNSTIAGYSAPGGDVCRFWMHTGEGNVDDTLEVPANATAVLFELRWEDPANDIDLLIYGPGSDTSPTAVVPSRNHFRDCSAGSEAYHAILVRPEDADPFEGTWEWALGAKGVIQDPIPFEIAVTVFHEGSEPPEGFTAFAPRG